MQVQPGSQCNDSKCRCSQAASVMTASAGAARQPVQRQQVQVQPGSQCDDSKCRCSQSVHYSRQLLRQLPPDALQDRGGAALELRNLAAGAVQGHQSGSGTGGVVQGSTGVVQQRACRWGGAKEYSSTTQPLS